MRQKRIAVSYAHDVDLPREAVQYVDCSLHVALPWEVEIKFG